MDTQYYIVITLIAFLPILGLLLLMSFARWYLSNQGMLPLNDETNNPPGYHAMRRLRTVESELLAFIFFPPFILLWFYVCYLLITIGIDKSLLLPNAYFFVAYGTVFSLLIFLLWLYLKRVALLRLLHRAQAIVGMHLNTLTEKGFKLFHNVRVNRNLSIDHVLVHNKGVFLVITLAQPKSLFKSNKLFRAQYQEGKIIFPGKKDTKSLKKLEKDAKAFANYLSRNLGELVGIRPVLIIPGWVVERRGNPPLPILSVKQIDRYFNSAQHSEKMNDFTVEKICTEMARLSRLK